MATQWNALRRSRTATTAVLGGPRRLLSYQRVCPRVLIPATVVQSPLTRRLLPSGATYGVPAGRLLHAYAPHRQASVAEVLPTTDYGKVRENGGSSSCASLLRHPVGVEYIAKPARYTRIDIRQNSYRQSRRDCLPCHPYRAQDGHQNGRHLLGGRCQ